MYSGYLNISSDENIFFWFFESRNKKHPLPSESIPLTIWLNGGPGCSSLIGLFQELGPCSTINNGALTQPNPNSWNEVSHMLFIDQSERFQLVLDFPMAIAQKLAHPNKRPINYVFLQKFFEKFPEYAKLDLHFFGESYAGHYISGCCKSQKNCGAIDDQWCAILLTFYEFSSGRSVYDIKDDNDPLTDFVNYLNQLDVIKQIGAKKNFEMCSTLVFYAFDGSGDFATNTTNHIEYLLDKNIPTLLYHGNLDFICNWYGGHDVALNLKWSHADQFRKAPVQEWSVNGKKAGTYQEASNLRFVRVYNAGHEVPFYQPEIHCICL
ncbi:12846_t:CDS:2 [Ambispora leptoticha]|uniref:12846_t:CDS:1 n=1 Tax=Ambispora leptoticha TaxID=144679 RepID=A0A9N9G1P9_9GLOM|nr:12846_t:CDS:2 [Ambispora leptoticha]